MTSIICALHFAAKHDSDQSCKKRHPVIARVMKKMAASIDNKQSPIKYDQSNHPVLTDWDCPNASLILSNH